MNDDAESVNVHDRVKTLLFEHHFAVDRVKMFFATANATRNSRLLQTSFDFREDFWIISLRLPRRFYHFFDDAVTIGIQRFKTQLFQLGFDVMNT